jgi:nitroimidazol reductase NimA-like FMN-containing flavoprotein (pyridoxamine 5'-phosphate oxidase superfamily)
MDAEKENLMRSLLAEPVLARLATANAKTLQPHVVPVWFLWEGNSLWISAFISTRKVKDLQKNPRCAVLIEPAQPQGSPLQAVLLEGAAELIAEPASLVAEMSERIYTKYMGPEGVLAPEPQSWKQDPENRLVRLTPERRIAW